jgi:hypothetical protein
MHLRNELILSAKLKEEPYVRATTQVLDCVEGCAGMDSRPRGLGIRYTMLVICGFSILADQHAQAAVTWLGAAFLVLVVLVLLPMGSRLL